MPLPSASDRPYSVSVPLPLRVLLRLRVLLVTWGEVPVPVVAFLDFLGVLVVDATGAAPFTFTSTGFSDLTLFLRLLVAGAESSSLGAATRDDLRAGVAVVVGARFLADVE